MTVLLSTAYWPNLLYFYHVFNAGEVIIEQHESLQKQSYRNRTEILSANGLLSLTVPLRKPAGKELTRDTRISHAVNWQQNHWRAITSAYKNSPYFEFFEDDLKRFYTSQFERLLDFNLQQLDLVLNILRHKIQIRLTTEFVKVPVGCTDLRASIHPKVKGPLPPALQQPYYQTFGNKFGFAPNLSILDLLFNAGLKAVDYLTDTSYKSTGTT